MVIRIKTWFSGTIVGLSRVAAGAAYSGWRLLWVGSAMQPGINEVHPACEGYYETICLYISEVSCEGERIYSVFDVVMHMTKIIRFGVEEGMSK